MSHSILIEKEKKIKETMKIMGMKDLAFFLSWTIKYIIIYFVISVLVTLILYFSIFNNSNYLIIFLWYYTFCLSLVFQSIFITTLFNDAKIGNIACMVFYIILFMLYYLLSGIYTPYYAKAAASIST